jgi:NAD(P)-dependent dehydrogenase (short-subunit alcohol dehydrogenase family)
MDLGLAGRVAVVTGVSHGIGHQTAQALLAEGATVVGVSRSDPEPGLEAIHHLRADILDPDTPLRLIELGLEAGGRIDVLVNNAGYGWIRAGYHEVDEEQWRRSWELLFLASVRMTEAALPSLLRSDGGTIINVSSRNARVPVPAVPDYSAAKAALNNYSKGLAGEYANRGLRVITVSPGPTATPLWLGPHGAAAQRAALEGGDAASIAEAAGERMPHGRFVKAEEVADLIAFLASPRAASISGIDILIDAGLTQTL